MPESPHTMKITSEKKAAAARANGALSRGPITPDGKARSSQNALQHGLFATTVVLAFEEPEQFRAFYSDYCDYYQPEGRVEHDIIYQLAACVWRTRRAYAMETELLNQASDAFPPDRGAVRRLTDGFFNVSDSAGAKNLDRYQARLDRTQSRLIHDFFRLRREHKPPVVAADTEPPSRNLPNEPITPNISNDPIPIRPRQPPTRSEPAHSEFCILNSDSSLPSSDSSLPSPDSSHEPIRPFRL